MGRQSSTDPSPSSLAPPNTNTVQLECKYSTILRKKETLWLGNPLSMVISLSQECQILRHIEENSNLKFGSQKHSWK